MTTQTYAYALALCTQIPVLSDAAPIWLQVTPAGVFGPSDGRDIPVTHWRIDAASAQRVIQRVQARRTPPVVDYEHQTLRKEENGQPAPAAGWMRELEWREGQGLFARVELTTRARQYIAEGEYRYFSPVFLYDPLTGEVLDVQMGALTNYPAIDGMQALSLRAAACFGLSLGTNKQEESSVNPLLIAVCAALALAENTTEEQAIVALTAHQKQRDSLNAVLGIKAGDDPVAVCTGLKAKAATGVATPDPSQYVPVAAVQGLQAEVAALTARIKERDDHELNAQIEAALNDGRLLKPMEDWARDLGKTNRAALTSYLSQVQPIAALAGSQTGGKPPVTDDKTGLTEGELAICTSMGLTPEQFKAAKV